jgi:hypothetical protein
MRTAEELARGEIDARTASIGNTDARVVVWITRQVLAGETQYDVDTYVVGRDGDRVLVQVDSTDRISKAREIQRMRLGEFAAVVSDMSDLVTP